MLLYLRYSYISTKMRLLKTIIIDSFVILLAYINLDHSYLILFLNSKQLSTSPSIFATSTMTFLSPTDFSTNSFLLS